MAVELTSRRSELFDETNRIAVHLPSPAELGEYERLVPGTSERILKMQETVALSRSEAERQVLLFEQESGRRRVRIAYVTLIVCLILLAGHMYFWLGMASQSDPHKRYFLTVSALESIPILAAAALAAWDIFRVARGRPSTDLSHPGMTDNRGAGELA